MYILNIASAVKKMSVSEIRDSENYYKRIGFSKENSYYSVRHQKKKDLLFFATKSTEKNTLPLYQSFIRKKNKFSKESKIMTQQPKTFENPNIVDIKSVIIEHANISHKLSKTIRQSEKVS